MINNFTSTGMVGAEVARCRHHQSRVTSVRVVVHFQLISYLPFWLPIQRNRTVEEFLLENCRRFVLPVVKIDIESQGHAPQIELG